MNNTNNKKVQNQGRRGQWIKYKTSYLKSRTLITTTAVFFLIFASVAAIQIFSNTSTSSYNSDTEITGDTDFPGLDAGQPFQTAPENFLQSAITETGIQIEFISLEVQDTSVDIYLLLRDLEKDRLDKNITVDFSIEHKFTMLSWIKTQQEVVRYNPKDGAVTLHIHQIFDNDHLTAGPDLENQTISLTLHTLFYNTREYQELIIPIDFGTINHNPLTINTNPNNNTTFSIWSNFYDSGHNVYNTIDDIQTQIDENGLVLLAPHQLDWEMDVDDIGQIISSIGIIDDQLRIQLYNPPMEELISEDFIWDPRTTFPRDSLADLFLIDPDGNQYRNHIGIAFEIIDHQIVPLRNGWWHNSYNELMIDIDISRLAAYQLAGDFTVVQRTSLDWEATLNLPTMASK